MNTEASMNKKSITQDRDRRKADVNKIWYWHPPPWGWADIQDWTIEQELAVRRYWTPCYDHQGGMQVFHIHSVTLGEA
jgi:hypothetical protein